MNVIIPMIKPIINYFQVFKNNSNRENIDNLISRYIKEEKIIYKACLDFEESNRNDPTYVCSIIKKHLPSIKELELQLEDQAFEPKVQFFGYYVSCYKIPAVSLILSAAGVVSLISTYLPNIDDDESSQLILVGSICLISSFILERKNKLAKQNWPSRRFYEFYQKAKNLIKNSEDFVSLYQSSLNT